MFRCEDASAPAAAGGARYHRLVPARVERQLDVILGRTIGRQSHAPTRRDHREREALRAQDVRHLLEERNGRALEELFVGARGFVVAATDVGILNLTRFEVPKPDGWFFGQRTLASEIRDLYGRLIDGMRAERGTLRSGGDGSSNGMITVRNVRIGRAPRSPAASSSDAGSRSSPA